MEINEINPPPYPDTLSEYEYDLLVDLGVIKPVQSDDEEDEEPADWELEYIEYLESGC